ncbi:hypothetical protein HDV01_001552 [Terramyces sp. JEL0728]|nr:hypothetical protein HDV01_001552 [Terramyces sp. JEL0728]
MKIYQIIGVLLEVAKALTPNGSVRIPVAVLIDSLGGVNDDSDLIEAVFARIDQLNHQNASLIDPDATLVPKLYNYEQDNQLLISDTLDIIAQKEIFIIGTGWSSFSTIASLISQNSLIPICDGASTNPNLGRKDLYPNFFRTIPTDTAGSEAMANYIHSQGWGKIATINTDEDYGNGAITSFLNYADALNITVLSRQLIETNIDDAGAYEVAQQILSAEARIIVYFGMPENYETVVVQATKVGVYGKGYFWVGSDSLQQLVASPDLTGTAFLFPLERADGSEADAFDAYWKENRLNVNNPVANVSSVNSSGPYGYFESSCVDLMALGFDALVKANGNNATKLALGMLNSQMEIPTTFSFPDFKTTTGQIVFDSSGERGGDYGIFNFQEDLTCLMVSEWANNEEISLFPYLYPGGSNAKPADAIDPVTVADYLSSPGDVLAQLVYALFGLGILVSIVTAVSFTWYKARPAIKSSDYFVGMAMQGVLFLSWFDLLTMVGKPTKFTCVLNSIIIPITFTAYYGLMFIKTYRIYTIFMKPLSRFKLNLYMVIGFGLLFTLPAAILILVWNIVNYPKPTAATIVKGSYAWTCSSSSASFQGTMVYLLVTYSAIVLLCNLYLAFKARSIPSKYNETNMITYSIYNTILVVLFASAILLTQGLAFRLKEVVKMVAHSYIILFNLSSVFLLKVYKALTDVEDVHSGSKTAKTVDSSSTNERASKGPKDSKTVKDSVVLMKKIGFFNDWASRAMIADSKDMISFWTYTKVSLEDKKGTIDANGESWNRKYLKEFKCFNVGATQRRFIVNREKYEIIFPDEDAAVYWDNFFQNWSSGKMQSFMARSVVGGVSMMDE